jgi:hypothetical protein
MRISQFSTLFLGIALMALLPPVLAEAAAPAASPAPRDGSHDFDFLYGRWHVHNRLLQKQPDGTQAWEEFDSADECHALPYALGNEESYRTDHWKGFAAMAIRLYNPTDGQWSIYWAENDEPGTIETPPVVGAFTGNVGTFFAKQGQGDKAYTIRFTWTILGKDSARWEQAISKDDGKSWKTLWTMDFVRDTG